MVTNYPEQLSATRETTAPSAAESVMSKVASRLSQTLCGLSGHDSVVHFEGQRVMMRCTSCGHDTPGWEVSGRGPRRLYEGDAKRHQLDRRPELVVLRKSA
jgi:NAD-dependent SIR2 family protein deacetylase